MKRFGFLVLFIAFISFSVFFIVDRYGFNTKQLIYEKTIDEYNYDLSDEYIIFSNDVVLRVNKQGVQAFRITPTSSKSILWKQDYSILIPCLVQQKDLLVVFDKLGYSAYVFNDKGKVYEAKTTMPIYSVTINDQGYIAVLQKQDRKSEITVFDHDGQKLLSHVSYQENEGIPIELAISPDSRTLAASFIDMTQNIILSKIVFFEIDNKDLKDNLYATYEYSNSIVTYLKYLNKDDIIGIGDNKLIHINLFNNEQREFEIEDQIKNVYLGFDACILILSNKKANTLTEENTYLMYYNNRFKLTKERIIYSEIENMDTNGNTIVLGKGSNYFAYGANAALKWKFSFPEDVRQVIPFNKQNIALVVSNKSIDIYKIQTSNMIVKN